MFLIISSVALISSMCIQLNLCVLFHLPDVPMDPTDPRGDTSGSKRKADNPGFSDTSPG